MTRTKLARTTALTLAFAATASLAAAQGAPPSQRNFVACPMVMDTQDAPCWVAEYNGERYFLTVQTGRGAGGTIVPPELRHKAMVEGTVTDAPRICGGIVLNPVILSPITDELDNSCNTVLPSGGYHTTSIRAIGLDGDPPEGIAKTVGGSFGQRKGDAERRALYAANAKDRKPMTFEVRYYFGSTYIIYPVQQENVEDAVDYAKLVGASKVKVTAYRAQALLSDGHPFPEKSGLAERRAKNIERILLDFGWPKDKLEVTWNDTPQDNGGIGDNVKRRTEIAIIP